MYSSLDFALNAKTKLVIIRRTLRIEHKLWRVTSQGVSDVYDCVYNPLVLSDGGVIAPKCL